MLAATAWRSNTAPLEKPLDRQLHLDQTTTRGVRVAPGQRARGLAGFPASHTEATHARRVATLIQTPPGSFSSYEHVALQANPTVDPDQAQAFVHGQLGALAAGHDTSLRLMDTLQSLGVDENTISYRIRQVEEILGRSVEDHTLDLRVALPLASAVKPNQPR